MAKNPKKEILTIDIKRSSDFKRVQVDGSMHGIGDSNCGLLILSAEPDISEFEPKKVRTNVGIETIYVAEVELILNKKSIEGLIKTLNDALEQLKKSGEKP